MPRYNKTFFVVMVQLLERTHAALTHSQKNANDWGNRANREV
jgi:hypothetical protein